MKKYGKYEKMADGTRAKQPKAKSLLLQTYFTSLLSLVLCVSMFFGTSYAWFTSEVENAGNEIYIGTLDVGLFAGDKDLSNSDNKLFDKNIRWEPGYTALETIKIKNEGDLAFRYVLNLIPAAHDSITKPDAQSNETIMELAAVAEFFDVWVYDHQKTGNAGYSKPESYAAITAENSGWDNVGTLADILSGESVLTGAYTSEMIAAAKTTKAIAAAAENSGEEETTPPDPYTGDPDAVAYTIALHMNERAESDVMGHKISLNVKLVAYQWTSEEDSFGKQYDETVIVDSIETLKEAIKNDKIIALSRDIIIERPADCLTMQSKMLDGRGYKIIYAGDLDNGKAVPVLVTEGGIISNLTIEGKQKGRALYMAKLKSDLVVSDCTLSGEYAFILNSSEKNEKASVKFVNTSFLNKVSFANAANHAYFTDCKFTDTLKPYGDATLTNCSFEIQGLDISEFKETANETVTVINCTYNGQLIEKAVLTSNGGVVTISESDAIEVDNDMVVLKGNG